MGSVRSVAALLICCVFCRRTTGRWYSLIHETAEASGCYHHVDHLTLVQTWVPDLTCSKKRHRDGGGGVGRHPEGDVHAVHPELESLREANGRSPDDGRRVGGSGNDDGASGGGGGDHKECGALVAAAKDALEAHRPLERREAFAVLWGAQVGDGRADASATARAPRKEPRVP